MKINPIEESKEDEKMIIPLLRAHSPKNSEELKSGSTPAGAIFVLINAALGAGLLAFPHAFWSSSGIVMGLILQAVRL